MTYSYFETRVKKILKNIVIVVMILSISLPSFFNIIYAEIGGSNLPRSVLKYDANDNSSVFPDSYKTYINSLKSKHPNWVFKALYTGLGWSQSLTQESYDTKTGISTVPDSYSSKWKKDGVNNYSDGSFVIASKAAVAYTMDPRNFLNESGIFQFEALDFNAETSSVNTINKILTGTPMVNYPNQYKKAGSMVTFDNALTWSQIIINAAKNAGGNGISDVFLASRMKQETSLDIINNGSINGSSSVYPGIYNFFNIGAVPDSNGQNSVTNGLAYASNPKDGSGNVLKNRDGSVGWTTPIYSIDAGATYLWSNYIQWGQNTVYFQKFDVCNIYGNAVKLYAYQYMTNILAPSSEAQITYNAYANANLLDSNFVFYVPVYGVLNTSGEIISDAMPSTITPHPDTETPAITGPDLVYMDDDVINGTDLFYVRSGPGTEYNRIYNIYESSEGADNRTKYTRTQVGTNGWDKIRLPDGTEGYVSQSYVRTYNYTHVTGVTLDKTSVSLKATETSNLVATVAPANAYVKNISWSSNNPGVATVDNNGKVTAVAVGTTNITVTTLDGNKTATCTVTVNPTQATSITMSSANYPLVVGTYLQDVPTISPATTTNKGYNITVQDTTIATVESGKIKGLKVGTTTATYTTTDGSNKSVTVTLNVSENVAIISNLDVDINNIITKVDKGTLASAIKSNVATSYTKKLVNANNVELNDTDKVCTGTKVQILNGTSVIQEYTIAIYGDVNGDGNISSSDYVLVKNNIMSSLVLNNSQKIGADMNKDGKISSSDYVLIKNYIMSH